MKFGVSKIAIACSLAVLAGCTSGTTYGTGTSHEEQTIRSITNMLAVTPKEKPNISYNARPDLVMPANKNVLPAPVDETQSAADPNWPVSPEQRIAAIKEGAPEPDEYGNLPTEYLTSKKEGIRNSADIYRASRANDRAGGGEQFLREIQNDANGVGESVEARKRRNELAYSTGVKRKYLTEPPTEYRVPSENAEAGELGITKEEISAAQKKAEKDKFNTDRGVLAPGAD